MANTPSGSCMPQLSSTTSSGPAQVVIAPFPTEIHFSVLTLCWAVFQKYHKCLILTVTPGGRVCFCAQMTDEAQRGEIICPNPHNTARLPT